MDPSVLLRFGSILFFQESYLLHKMVLNQPSLVSESANQESRRPLPLYLNDMDVTEHLIILKCRRQTNICVYAEPKPPELGHFYYELDLLY